MALRVPVQAQFILARATPKLIPAHCTCPLISPNLPCSRLASRLHIIHVIIVTSIASLTTIPGSSGTPLSSSGTSLSSSGTFLKSSGSISLSSSGSNLRWRRLVNWLVGLEVLLRPIGVVSAEFGVGASSGLVSYFFADYTFES